MKIRIKGPSVRIRLSRSEVAKLVQEGRVAEHTPFGQTAFHYVLQSRPDGEGLSAQLEGSTITMFVPQRLIQDWDTNDLITIDNYMPAGDGQLYLLLEKDFQCIDATGEDQSDNYVNPNQTC